MTSCNNLLSRSNAIRMGAMPEAYHQIQGLLVGILMAVAVLTTPSALLGQYSSVQKQERDLVVFCTDLSPSTPGPKKAFYDFIAFAGVNSAKTTMTPVYRKVHVVQKNAAKREAIWKTLQLATQNNNVKAVDLIFISHGLENKVELADGTFTMDTIKNDIVGKLSASQRAKLRIVFDTSCYSQSHNAGWRAAGFKAASGSKKIYADSIVSYQPFLVAWATNKTFQQSVATANAADIGKATDNAAKLVLKAANYAKWNDVDSTRVVSGDSGLKISTMK